MNVDYPITAEAKAELARRLFEHVENRTTDLAPATMSFPRSEYFDPELAARERRVVFGQAPIVVAHSSEIAGPNDFLTRQLPNNQALVVRQPDGRVRTFVNTCAHRGARVECAASGSQRVFMCRYHGWVYNGDGSLRSILAEDTFGDVDKATLGMRELPTEERHGFVWVVDNVDAVIDVAGWLGPMDDVLASYDPGTYTCFVKGEFPAAMNWKVLVDAFLDGYHLATTHPQTAGPYFYNNIYVFEELGRCARFASPRKSIDRIRTDPPGAHPIDNHITAGHFFFPNTTMLRQPDHFELLSYFPDPHDSRTCRMEMRILIPKPPANDEERKRWEKNWAILQAVLQNEDLVLCTDLQKAAENAGAGPDLILGRNEIANQLFHREMAAMLAGAEA